MASASTKKIQNKTRILMINVLQNLEKSLPTLEKKTESRSTKFMNDEKEKMKAT